MPNPRKPSAIRPKLVVQYSPGSGYAVFRHEPYSDKSSLRDARVSEFFRTDAEARAERDAMQATEDARAKRGPRPCLCCGDVFESEGVHNRLCNPCRGRDAGDDAQRPYIAQRRMAA